MTRQEFIGLIAPIAVKLRLEGSTIFPSMRIAQALLETGGVIHSWNNLVGYKVGSGHPNAYWDGRSISTQTWEDVQEVHYDNVMENFRVYDTIEDCFRDQDLLFENDRYAGVRTAKNPMEQTKGLTASGYATDPDYAIQLNDMISVYGLTQYDEEVITMLEQLQKQLNQLKSQIEDLQNKAALPEIPDWAKESVDAAVAAGVIDTPQGGSYDFYRLLTVLHRKGLV